MAKLLINAAKCRKCGDTIVSRYTWDFVRCKCGAIAVDGGLEYARSLGNREDFHAIYEYEEEKKDE